MAWLVVVLAILLVLGLVLHDARRQGTGTDLIEEGPARSILSHYGIERSSWAKLRDVLVYVFVGVVFAGILYLIVQLFLPAAPVAPAQGAAQQPLVQLKDVIQICVVSVGFLIAYVQWRLARYEASLEKYYDRLDVANKRLGTMLDQDWAHIPEGGAAFDVYACPPRVGVSYFDLWVFAELDNFEYVIEKYRRGYIEHAQACRGLRAFRKRCLTDPTFLRKAVEFCADPHYHDMTRAAVRRLRDEIPRPA
jgi:hypothetical protein